MKKIKRILDLRFTRNLSKRAIARTLGVGRSSVARVLERAELNSLTWPLPESVTEAKRAARLYPAANVLRHEARPVPDWGDVYRQLTHSKILMLKQLWKAYYAHHPTGYQHSHFCERYRAWRQREVDPVMRHTHKAGQRLFVDYSGKQPALVDPISGAVREVELFVAVLGVSNYTYAEASMTQGAADFYRSLSRTFRFLGGVPRAVVPINLKAAMVHFKKDDVPVLNRSFEDLLDHYRVSALPARLRKPRDKAKVESGVLHVQRQVLAALRNLRFFSLQELNAAIREQITVINGAPFQKLTGSRDSWFEQVDKPALRPLPAHSYQYGQWTSKRKVGTDCRSTNTSIARPIAISAPMCMG